MSGVLGSGQSNANTDATTDAIVSPPDGPNREARDDKVNDAPASGDASLNKASGTGEKPSSIAEDGGESVSMNGFRDAPEKQYNFIGSTFHSTNFGGEGRSERTRTWTEELKKVDRSWLFGGNEEPDSIFDSACQAWTCFRIVVLRYHPGGRFRAEGLMKRISRWASERMPACKLLSTGNHLALPLKDLALPDTWPQEYFGSLIYLARRNEPYTARFFSISNGVEVKSLHERLEKTDARLVISLAAEWDAIEGSLDPFDDSVCTLEVAGAQQRAMPVAEDKAELVFDAVPRIIAGLFAGMKVDEYQELVNQFLPKLEVPVSPPKETADKKDETPTPSVQPTRHQRWIMGDIDRVLAELGVRYEMVPADITRLRDSRTPGYYLADDASPYANPGWVIANYPALLSSRIDMLLTRYLGRSASERYQETFLSCLARLDTSGVHAVSAGWLLKGWQAVLDAETDALLAARKLCWLVEYLQVGREDPDARFAKSVIDELAIEAANLEIEFQQEVGTEPLRQALELYAQDHLKEPDKVWSWLVDNPATRSATLRFSERQAAAQWTILQLSRNWPIEAAQSFTKILDQVTDTASLWRMLAQNWNILDEVPRCAAVNTKSLLSLLLADSPDLWVSFANGVSDSYACYVQEAMAKGSVTHRMSAEKRQAAIKGQRLAFTSLYALAPRIYGPDDEQKRHVLRRLCLSDGNPTHGISVLGRLLAMSYLPVDSEPMLGPVGEGSLSIADVVRYLRGIALFLQSEESLSAEQVNDALAQIASSLRALTPLETRRLLMNQTRYSIDSQFHTRDHFEAIGDRRALANIRKNIRASQAVLRSLGAYK